MYIRFTPPFTMTAVIMAITHAAFYATADAGAGGLGVVLPAMQTLLKE